MGHDHQPNDEAPGPLQAQARALVAGIAAYERDARTLRDGWDAHVYARALQRFEDLRALALCLHRVQADWAAVLISRFAFTDTLWKQRNGQEPGARLHEAHEAHAAALRQLRLACERAYGLPPRASQAPGSP